MSKKHMILLVTSMSVAACGTMPEDRAISGAGIGAAGGAIVGAVTGLTVVQGALIGAVTGAMTGVLTDEDKVNLGKPVWKQGSASASQTNSAPATAENTAGAPARKNHSAGTASGRNTVATPASDRHTATMSNSPVVIADKKIVMEIQSGLIRLGYNPGPVDGINGKRTSKAIRTYQEYHGLTVDGMATPELAEHIRTRTNYLGGVRAQQTVYAL